ncbi:uncharacterized protein LOC141646397 [Silene latifolia]|uniref:uncharacterized protein LOC141646397 n=1 Tax=Silene latifolia TaxID=37657 RepID=UPI003D77A6F8
MNRELFLVEQSKKFRASAYTKFKEETEKTRNETEGVFKLLEKIKEEEQQSRLELLEKIKEEEERSKLTKELLIKSSRRMEDAPPMHDLDRVQKENKELVAKLEKAEKDRKFAVQSRIELIKILDEETKKVLCLDRVQKENKELVAKLEKAEEDRKFAVQNGIELIKILDGLRKKVSCLAVKCVNLESQNQALEEKVLKADEKLEKLKVEREELMERIASLEEQLKKAVEIEVDKLVDGNTDEYENNTMFGSEDDTVYVDFDQVVRNF